MEKFLLSKKGGCIDHSINQQTIKKTLAIIIWDIHRYSHLARQTNINLQSQKTKKRVGRKEKD